MEKLSCLAGKKVTASPSPKLGVQKVVFESITEGFNEEKQMYNLNVTVRTENGGKITQMFFQKSIEDGSDNLVQYLTRVFGTYNEETQSFEVDLSEVFVEGLEFTGDVAYSNRGSLQVYPPRETQSTVESEPAVTGM